MPRKGQMMTDNPLTPATTSDQPTVTTETTSTSFVGDPPTVIHMTATPEVTSIPEPVAVEPPRYAVRLTCALVTLTRECESQEAARSLKHQLSEEARRSHVIEWDADTTVRSEDVLIQVVSRPNSTYEWAAF